MGLARIGVSTFAARQGKTLTCEGCRKPIEKGARYQHFKVGFRSRTVHVYHIGCQVPDSARASGKMAGVYSANDDLRAELNNVMFGAGDDASEVMDAISSALDTAAQAWRDVGEEYREAAEASPTGMVFGVDYNEVADSFDSAADSLEGFSADEDEPDYESCDNEAHADDAAEPVKLGSADCESCEDIAARWLSDLLDAVLSHVEDAQSEIEVG